MRNFGVVSPTLGDLVVIVPGVGGSELVDTAGRSVWGGPLAKLTVQAVLPGRLSLAESPYLSPVGLLGVARSVPGFAALHPYVDLIGKIQRSFAGVVYDDGDPAHRNLNANLVAFPYDFRRSVVEAAERLDREVRDRLDHLGANGEGRARVVVVVAHSMGGLVARYWLGPMGGGSLCRRLYTLGTPHRGAPKALDWLVNGVSFKGVAHPWATAVIRSWVSPFELLPRYKVVKTPEGDRYPHELGLEVLSGRATKAFDVHLEIEQAWSDPEAVGLPKMLAFFGHGHDTPSSAEFDGKRLTVTDAEPEFDAEGWYGDSTVPRISAIPIELSDNECRDWWRPTVRRHGPLGSASEVVDELRILYGAPLAGVTGPEETMMASLGLALDDTHIAGSAVDVGVVLRNVDPAPGVVMRSVVMPEGRPDLEREVALARSGDIWSASITGLGPGMYRVEVMAEGVARGDTLRCRDWTMVVQQ